MSVDALPYTALLLLAQLTAGLAIVVLFVQLRGGYELAFIRTCTWLTITCSLLTLLTVAWVDPKNLPTRACVAVELGSKDTLVEIVVTAAK